MKVPDRAERVDTVRPWWLLPQGRLPPALWLPVFLAIVWSDYLGGVEFFPLLYGIPVGLAAWYSGRRSAMALAIAVPLVRLAFLPELPDRGGLVSGTGLTTIARGVVVLFLGLWFARLSALERALDHRVRVLEGLLPICAYCKSIRNEAGDWERFEAYISRKSEAEFSHGVCPSCGAAHSGGIVIGDNPPNQPLS